MSSERYIPNYDFEPGELMSWQEMTALLRELKERCLEQLTILSAQISDIKTRLDDLEESVGTLLSSSLSEEFGVELVLESGNSSFEEFDSETADTRMWAEIEAEELWGS